MCLLVALLVLALSGCGVHGLTGIYNQEAKTTQVLERILHELEHIDQELAR